ncbi:unnamed protein product [Clonostachys byssicola]|uniref:Xylose isomerase-like TIM barrel domain-containing protein n=1 Tax=Clonostachys byssicola TaxID=160290 RepID=A0A9N9YAV1_9HYPO|nr:unnamed protein product [Clonostachys byssicola]
MTENRLRVNLDISHWSVACERLLDQSDEDMQLLERIFPFVHHIHSRIGTTQSSQCPDPSDPIYQPEVQCFENIWRRVILTQVERDGPNAIITFVPEWGPYPYHPRGSVREFSEVADTEGARQQGLFERICNIAP